MRLALITCLLVTLWAGSARADDPSATATVPDIHALLLEVEAHQKQLEKIREDYTYREIVRSEDLDSNGSVKKIETDEFEVFFVNTHPIRRQVGKDGKELSANEQKKEQDRVNKEVEKATKTPPGEALNGDTISVGRLLQIIEIKNPRRLNYKNRPTIAFDFAGDPHAKTHGMTEDISKKLSGTVWIDEEDRQVARMEAHIDDNFHMGGGLVASIQKGSSFTFDQALVNRELWLPTGADIRFSARVLLFKGVRQNIHVQDDRYQKFRTDATQAPGVTLTTPAKP